MQSVAFVSDETLPPTENDKLDLALHGAIKTDVGIDANSAHQFPPGLP